MAMLPGSKLILISVLFACERNHSYVLGFDRMMRTVLSFSILLCAALCAHTAIAETHPGERALVREVAADTGKNATALTMLLDRAQYKQSIIDAISRPAEGKPWSEYRPIFVNPARIDAGIDFYVEHRALLQRIGARYGVPPQYLVAIVGVETSYGGNTGHYRVLDALATLTFHYPPRAAFFRGELKTLLELPDDKLAGPLDTLVGSYAGAQGWGQFMPSSIRDYAVDADSDGRVDLNGSLPDILSSVAHYFAAHGWQSGEPVAVRALPGTNPDPVPDYAGTPPVTPVEQFTAAGYAPSARVNPGQPASLLTLDGDNGDENWLVFDNFYVITRYNKSPRYAMAVYQLANEIARGAMPPAEAAR